MGNNDSLQLYTKLTNKQTIIWSTPNNAVNKYFKFAVLFLAFWCHVFL